jgi:AcrR family transcriptional regulator
MIETSVKTYSRAVGILLIVSMAGGFFGEMYVPSLMMADDAAATAAQLRTHEGLFRLGFGAYLLEAVSDVVLAWLFYVLLKPVHRDLALLSAFLGLVSTTLFAVTKMFYFAAPMFVRESKYLTAFPPEQLDAFATLFLSLYGVLSGLTMLFYGIPWIIRGYLTYKSDYLPRLLGVLMIAAGIGFVAKTLTYVLAPAYSSDLLLAPMFLNAVAVAIWMLFRGVQEDRREVATAA